jgi:hypothetical protein
MSKCYRGKHLLEISDVLKVVEALFRTRSDTGDCKPNPAVFVTSEPKNSLRAEGKGKIYD